MLNRDNSYCAKNLGVLSQKGAIPWNKGHRLTEEHKHKLSEAKKGKDIVHLHEYQWKKGHIPWDTGLKGELSPCYGRVPTLEQRQKISQALKGQPLSTETKQKLSRAHQGLHHTQEVREKISKTWKTPFYQALAKERRARQVLPKTDTKIETRIQTFLGTLGISYEVHKHMNIEHGYQCDIFVSFLNLVIECDGEYWHKYPTGTEVDRLRTQELVERGYQVLRLWGKEIQSMSLNDFAYLLNHGVDLWSVCR